jgi:hypothetical protein
MKKFGGKYPLLVEAHPENYNGYKFITLIRFADEPVISIVDNVCNKQIVAYVLDYCKPTNVDEHLIIEVADDWYNNNRENYPFSIEISKRNMAAEASKILRYFPIDYVSRVIGILPEYSMQGPHKVKKRKRRPIPKGIEYINRSSKKSYD